MTLAFELKGVLLTEDLELRPYAYRLLQEMAQKYKVVVYTGL